MSDEYTPKRAITTMTPTDVTPNQAGLLVHVLGILEHALILRKDGYESEDGVRWYATMRDDKIEVLL